jgi:hypothetical protein
MTPVDVLWGMYQEHCTQGRHHEDQRSTTTNLNVALAGGVAAFVSAKGYAGELWPLPMMVIAIGIFGALFSLKQYERFRFHMKCAGEYRDALEVLLPSTQLCKHRLDAESKHRQERRYVIVRWVHLFAFWIILNLLIAGIGIAILAKLPRH